MTGIIGGLLVLGIVLYGFLLMLGGPRFANQQVGTVAQGTQRMLRQAIRSVARTLWRFLSWAFRGIVRQLGRAIQFSWVRWPRASGMFWGATGAAVIILFILWIR